MRRSTMLLSLLLTGALIPSLLADTTSLQSILINANGTQYTDANLVPGVNAASWDGLTGLGTLSFTFDPGAAGAYYFDVFLDHQLNLPFFNEFGTVLGAPAAGQTYEIGDSFASNIYTDVQTGGALANTNTLPGQQSNFGNNCVGVSCNGDFAGALGFNFVLGAGEEAIITLGVSHTDPGSGLRLEDTHPVDGANPTALNVFISGNVAVVPTGGPTVPEPAGSVPFVLVGLIALLAFRRRPAVNS